MPTAKKEKTFDAVKMMREIRERISGETQNMSFEELKVYIKKQLDNTSTKPVGKWAA